MLILRSMEKLRAFICNHYQCHNDLSNLHDYFGNELSFGCRSQVSACAVARR